jgi:hypothetical protein
MPPRSEFLFLFLTFFSALGSQPECSLLLLLYKFPMYQLLPITRRAFRLSSKAEKKEIIIDVSGLLERGGCKILGRHCRSLIICDELAIAVDDI